jgi:(1->4)-alpha-D-glucan 1-alpha-D-glucosylmutase
VPDIYQGCELWDLNLVDPDNRRPIDFARREAEMDGLARRLEDLDQRPALFEALLREWPDGRIKLATTALLLALRRNDPEIFADGDYQPIVIEGDMSDSAFGYVRACGKRRLAVLLARFPLRRQTEPTLRAVARLPEGLWFDVFRGSDARGGDSLGDWLHPLPFAILTQ